MSFICNLLNNYYTFLYSRCLWDVSSGKRIGEWYGHGGDVVSMSLKPDDHENVFITGSVDQSAKLWDLREKASVQTFWGHTADVNSVAVSNPENSRTFPD